MVFVTLSSLRGGGGGCHSLRLQSRRILCPAVTLRKQEQEHEHEQQEHEHEQQSSVWNTNNDCIHLVNQRNKLFVCGLATNSYHIHPSLHNRNNKYCILSNNKSHRLYHSSSSSSLLMTSPSDDNTTTNNNNVGGDDVVSWLATSSSSSSGGDGGMEWWDWYNPSHYVIGLVQDVHTMTGFSYAASIATVTVGMRLLLLLPMDIVSRKEQVKRDVIRHQQEQLAKHYGSGSGNGNVDVKQLYERYNYNPQLRFVVPISSLILFISMLFGLKNVPTILTNECMGGIFWCTDITQPDPIRFLPIVSATTLFLMGEIGADTTTATTASSTKSIWFWRSVRIAICPIMLEMPASIFCFWIPNSVISLLQTSILNHSTIKTKWWNQIIQMNNNNKNNNNNNNNTTPILNTLKTTNNTIQDPTKEAVASEVVTKTQQKSSKLTHHHKRNQRIKNKNRRRK